MFHPRVFLSALTAVVLLCSIQTHAQQNNSTAEKTESTNAALREKAFGLLQSLAGEIGVMQSAENRARIGSNIVGSLWSHDEKRARALLVSVESDIKTGLQLKDNQELDDQHTLMVFLRLRKETIERIVKHDPELALEFFKATEISPDPRRSFDVAESDRALELSLAKHAAASAPNLALHIGRKSLTQGFSHDLLALLRQLNQKHNEQGRILYSEIVDKLRGVNLNKEWNTRNFAGQLVQSFPPPAADTSTFRDLINIFIKTGFSNRCEKSDEDVNRSVCYWLGQFVPEMERVDPSRAAVLKQWEPQYQGYVRPSQAQYQLNDLMEEGTPEEILALAPQHRELEVQIYMQAVSKAAASGDFELARKIANDFKGHPETRKAMLRQIEDLKPWTAIDDQKIVEILALVEEVQGSGRRVEYLLSIASQLSGSDKKGALKLMDRAVEIMDNMKPGVEQTAGRLALAVIYSLLKNDRGFVIMESLVPTLNDLVDAAARLDGYDTRYLRDGEWNMTGQGNLGGLLTWLAHHAACFAWLDFDRAVGLAGQFTKAEIRIMAQLKLAQGVLAGPPKRINMASLRQY